MARAQGARAQMALAFETVYGTAPASGYTRVPFASTSLGSEQPLITSELLGYGRDPLAPIKDAVTADGDVVVPIDAEAFGFWLKAAFGVPTTSGSGPYTHEFRSGGWTLPSMSIETAMPEVPRFAMYSGCVLDQLSWQMQRSGLLTATARLVAQGETVGTTTAAGTPAEPALKRFGHFNGSITRNGAALGNVVSAEITYANNLDRIETIRSDGRIDGADPSIAALTGAGAAPAGEDLLQARRARPCRPRAAARLHRPGRPGDPLVGAARRGHRGRRGRGRRRRAGGPRGDRRARAAAGRRAGAVDAARRLHLGRQATRPAARGPRRAPERAARDRADRARGRRGRHPARAVRRGVLG